MAIYHLTAKTVSRGHGAAAAKSDYIERENRYKKDHDELAYKASGNMPSWAKDMPRKYWDSADTYERENGRLFKQVEFALPKELTTEEQIQLATAFAEKIASTKDGKLPYSFAIHKGHGKGNPHCHMMLSERVNDGNSRTPETWFRRAGKGEKAGAKKTLELRPKDWLLSVRREWSHEANKALEKAGHQVRIDHRTLAAQGIDREPTQHRGPALCAMLAKGVTPRQREGEQEASREHTEILRQQLAEARAQKAEVEAAISAGKSWFKEQLKLSEQQKREAERQRLEAERQRLEAERLEQQREDARTLFEEALRGMPNLTEQQRAEQLTRSMQRWEVQPPEGKAAMQNQAKQMIKQQKAQERSRGPSMGR
jgi:hypothetical protein